MTDKEWIIAKAEQEDGCFVSAGMSPIDAKWAEYDDAAKWCAQRGLKGEVGDPLPTGISAEVFSEISAHPTAFAERVRDTAYALAMSKYAE